MTRKIAAVFCVYNEEEYLTYAVRSILPAVDRVYLLLGLTPYTAYNPNAREISQPDGTEAIADQLAQEEPKVVVIKDKWSSEMEHRSRGLQRCLEEGMDYFWLVDGDEVYRRDHLANIRRTLTENPTAGTFIIKCHTFWRSFSYRIPAEELTWRPRRIFKLNSFRRILGVKLPYRCRFTGQNEINSLGPVYEFHPNDAVFYHFSYARSDHAMKDKFRTFSHAHQISDDWIRRVWEKWPGDRGMFNIHPVDPPKFPQAVFQSPDDLPSALQKHPYYGLDIIQ